MQIIYKNKYKNYVSVRVRIIVRILGLGLGSGVGLGLLTLYWYFLHNRFRHHNSMFRKSCRVKG
jgi:hypothetical protein